MPAQPEHLSLNVLVIEDDVDTQANIRDILELDGHISIAASSFAEGLRRDDWHGVDVILMDRKLPDGTAEARLPEFHRVAPRTPIVVVTGFPDVQGAIGALREGAHDYLLKPIDPDALRASLKRILEQRRAEQALQISEARLRAILDAAPDAIITLDLDGIVQSTNLFSEELYGRHRHELVGHPIAEFIPLDQRDQFEQAFSQVRQGSRIKPFDAERIQKCGRMIPVSVALSAMRGPDGEVTGIVSIARDMTDQRMAQRTIRESESRLQAVLKTAADAIITIDHLGMVQSFNSAAERMFGYRASEVIGQNVKLLMPAPFRDEHDEYIAKYLRTGEARIIGIGREVIGRHKNGAIIPIDLAVSEISELGLFTGVIRDISERKRLETEVLRAAEIEQRRIGQELHDNVQQQLAGLGLLARTVADQLQASGASDTRLIERVAQGLADAGRHVRLLSRGLVPVEVDAQGLASALSELVDRTSELYGLTCRFECLEPPEVDDSHFATQLYRVAQEAMNNVVKHADASEVRVELFCTDGQVTLRVVDNGFGIRQNETRRSGAGLHIMSYRAGLLGGALRVERRTDGTPGTLVTCTVPLSSFKPL